MLTPDDIARQLEQANIASAERSHRERLEDHFSADAPMERLHERLLDPDFLGEMAEVDALLRIPETIHAIAKLTQSTREFVKGLTMHEAEFQHIAAEIKRLESLEN